ncbi:MAG: SDR family oxidoreductase [Pseudomonadota bacterium]|nr:SDR family oxidoreductase [Pseudomonadota bacterium]
MDESNTTLVTGASGPLGSSLITRMVSQGQSVRGMARSVRPAHLHVDWVGADLLTGNGLEQALSGIATVVHCASNAMNPREDLTAIDQLIAALQKNGQTRLIYVGIAGIELAATALPYYGIKLEVERRIIASGLPYAIVRATQFHPFVEFILAKLDLKFAVIAPSRIVLQPVSPEFVAEILAGHANSDALGRLPDLHGPGYLDFRELATQWLAARGRRSRVMNLPLPVPPFSGLARLQEVNGQGGGQSWAEWLGTHDMQDNPYLQRR